MSRDPLTGVDALGLDAAAAAAAAAANFGVRRVAHVV